MKFQSLSIHFYSMFDMQFFFMQDYYNFNVVF